MKKLLLAVAVFTLVFAALANDKKEKDKGPDIGPVSTLSFVVLKDANGKPVRNAAVVVHLVSDKGKQERGGLELKTDAEGKADYEGVPYGRMRVQVLATGFQTFGEDYEVNQPTMAITIKLKRPTDQYSIYEDHPSDKKDAPPAQKPQ
jgi:5-hydroxyisourate hydrolase-like protein (transthyretin family)